MSFFVKIIKSEKLESGLYVWILAVAGRYHVRASKNKKTLSCVAYSRLETAEQEYEAIKDTERLSIILSH